MAGDKRIPTILFLSELSDKRWPSAIAEAFPDFRVVTTLDEADPTETVAALVWKHGYGSLSAYTNLQILVNLGAGVDHLVGDPDLPAGVPIVRIFDPGLAARMAEYVLMHCLSLHRRQPEIKLAQANGHWNFMAPTPPSATCVGILGFGMLGRACAEQLSAIGFDVLGWKRTPGDAGGFNVYFGRDGLLQLASRAHIIVALLPSTASTRDLLDQAFFDRMRQGSAVINVGRGDLIVEQDLLAALDQGHLRHAVLDVFRREPLPSTHPFWRHPQITVSPHNSSALDPNTAIQQVVDNIRRALTKRPLLNRIDPETGY